MCDLSVRSGLPHKDAGSQGERGKGERKGEGEREGEREREELDGKCISFSNLALGIT